MISTEVLDFLLDTELNNSYVTTLMELVNNSYQSDLSHILSRRINDIARLKYANDETILQLMEKTEFISFVSRNILIEFLKLLICKKYTKSLKQLVDTMPGFVSSTDALLLSIQTSFPSNIQILIEGGCKFSKMTSGLTHNYFGVDVENAKIFVKNIVETALKTGDNLSHILIGTEFTGFYGVWLYLAFI